jgi:IS605 OrfB family transposase
MDPIVERLERLLKNLGREKRRGTIGYKPENIKPVDVNENSVATLYEAFSIIIETDLAKTTLGYSYRKKSIQRRNGSDSREARKAMKKLKEGKKKRDYRMKTANMIVRDALRMKGVIVIERISGEDIRVMIARYRDKQLRHRIYQSALKGELNAIIKEGKKKKDYRMKTANLIVRDALRMKGVIVIERISGDDIRVMIARYKNKQLRHRIYQSALKGELNAIIDKAREYGVPVLMVDPRNTSKICPIHNAPIEYGEDRIGICSKGGEKWHREVVALIKYLS